MTQRAREAGPPPAEQHAAHRRTVERMQAAVLAANTPPPSSEEELPRPEPGRLERLLEEARRNGELADPREASEETYPLTQISHQHKVRLYQQLQRTSNEVAYNQENARALRERLTMLRAQKAPAEAVERLEVQLSRIEHAMAGSKAWLDEMAPKLAKAGMPPIPAPEPGWEPPSTVDYHHGHGHDHGEHPEEHSQP